MSFTPDLAAIEVFARAPGGWEDVALVRKAVAVELLAKRFVHVDTGNLRASIGTRMEEDEGGRVAYVGSDSNYAIYQELEVGDTFPATAGKYANAPRDDPGGRPFLRPALQAGIR